VSTPKKATVKRTVKKATARKTTPPARARMSGPAVIDQAGAPVDEVIADDTVDEAEGAAEVDDAAPAALATIDLALSHRGKRTGKTHPVRVQRPTETQLVWFEAAAHRFDLAMEAWKEGAALGAGERGEVYNDALNAMNVFVATRLDRAWVSQAMASGILELDAVIEGIHQAKDVLDLAPTGASAGADIVVP
jgi:hypothetical protein